MLGAFSAADTCDVCVSVGVGSSVARIANRLHGDFLTQRQRGHTVSYHYGRSELLVLGPL